MAVRWTNQSPVKIKIKSSHLQELLSLRIFAGFFLLQNLLAHSAGPYTYPGHNISWTKQSLAVGKMNQLRKLAPAESEEALFVRSYRSKPERLV
jgi:hypothetical protein